MKNKLNTSHKLAIYMPHSLTHESGKMGLGILRFSTNKICCVIDPDHTGKNLKELTGIDKSIPIVSNFQEAIQLEANALILGIAPSGGRLPDTWTKPIEEALNAGFLVVNGLHDKLADKFSSLLARTSNTGSVWDVREVLKEYTIGSARANELNNKRILTIGTDMASGKMTAGLLLNEALLKNNCSSSFLATGQIGITISGQGIPLDAIKVDNAAAAVEDEVMSRQNFEHIIVEGQGSLGHPGSTATLPLMRGSCPTHLLLCHKIKETHLKNPVSHIPFPDLNRFIEMNEEVASLCGIFERPKTFAISLNTYGLPAEKADQLIAEVQQNTGIFTSDIVRYGAQGFFSALAKS